MSEEQLALIRPHMTSVRRPGTFDKVYNDECVFSYATPFSEGTKCRRRKSGMISENANHFKPRPFPPGGLFVSLSNWQGVGAALLHAHSDKTGSKLYLHITKTRVDKHEDEKGPSADEAKSMNDLLQVGRTV